MLLGHYNDLWSCFYCFIFYEKQTRNDQFGDFHRARIHFLWFTCYSMEECIILTISFFNEIFQSAKKPNLPSL
jgi:hypothetical protein